MSTLKPKYENTEMEFIFDSLNDAENIAHKMHDIIHKCGHVSVSDFYDLIGIESDDIDSGYGWTNLDLATIDTVENDNCDDYYRLTLPEPCKINDSVSHPSYYQSKNGLEVIDVINAFTDDLDGMEAVCTANILKYVCRWKKKNGAEDLKKAIWYAKYLVNYIQQSKKENKEETNNE